MLPVTIVASSDEEDVAHAAADQREQLPAASSSEKHTSRPCRRRWASGVLQLPAPSNQGTSSSSSSTARVCHVGTDKACPPSKKLKKSQGRPVVPSFLWQTNATVRTAEESSASSAVEVFMTIAGREGKNGSVTRSISLEELEKSVPVTFIPNLLPQAFADHLLRAFLQEGENWHKSKRWLYDREIESHRVESGFRFNELGYPSSSTRGFSNRWQVAGFSDDLRHLRGLVAGAVRRSRAELRQRWRAARGIADNDGDSGSAPIKLSSHELAQESVALASRGQRLEAQSIEWLVRYAHSTSQTWLWEPNYCVANLYKDENDFLGAHSDPVDSIGPWAIIASLTFGAARQFRMKPVGTVRTNLFGGGRVTSYSVRLPHNSLLVCWEGFQEFWRHEVPKDKGLTPHLISGPARLNFTFRKSVGSVAGRKPLCHCGRKADLKPVLKETSRNRGRYFWSCTNPRVKKGTYRTCDFFKWDDELLAETARSAVGPGQVRRPAPEISSENSRLVGPRMATSPPPVQAPPNAGSTSSHHGMIAPVLAKGGA